MKKIPLLRISLVLSLCAAACGALWAQPRVLPQLTVQDGVVHPIPLGFSSRSLMPWYGYGEAPALLVANHGPYIAPRSVIYRADGKDGSGKPYALPADYPLYKGGSFDDAAAAAGGQIGGAGFLVIDRKAEGLFDLVHPGNFKYYRNIGEPGKPKFEAPYEIKTAEPRKDGSQWIEDVTGDGIPDLLVGGMNNDAERFIQFPDAGTEKGPWSGEEHPNMGPLPDTDIQNFRGYDIMGNWMGQPTRKYLWWAKGARDAQGRLSFGPYKNVRYGSTDYKVQVQYWARALSPVVVHAENGTFIVLFTGPDRVLALPLRGETPDGELRTGKAVPLLKNGSTTLSSALLPTVIGRGDLNLDGVDEIVVGSGGNGRFTALAGKRVGAFEELGNINVKGGPIAGDTLTTVARGDWDGDGFADLVLGDGSGYYTLWRGGKDPLVYESFEYIRTPAGVIRHRPSTGNMQGAEEDAWSYTQPTLFDWDGDGKLDLISNDNAAQLLFYRNTGDGALVEAAKPFMMDGKPLPVAWRSRLGVVPGAYKLAGDARNCLLFMTWDRKMAYAVPKENGSLEIERVVDFAYEDGSPIVLAGPVGLSGRVKFAVTDWDGDGRWDVVLGVQHGLQKFFRQPGSESPSSAPYWLRNVGTNDKPVFEPARLITFADGQPIIVNKHDFTAFPTDLKKRGAGDLIFGDDEGFIFYLLREDLAWNESVEKVKEFRAKEARIRVQGMNLPKGVLAADDWNYPFGNLDNANGGRGWDGPWTLTGPSAKIEDSKTPGLKRVLVFTGEGKQNVNVRRSLAQPFNLQQNAPRTLVYAIAFQRVDNSDNGGNEAVVLLGLCNPRGDSIVTAGFDSGELLELKIGTASTRSAAPAIKFNASGILYVAVDLPVGPDASLKIRAKLSDKPITSPITQWDIEASGKIEGIVSGLSVAAAKYAGAVSVGPIALEVR